MSAVDSACRCPKCGSQLVVQSYGPFFTPDPTMRWAVACPFGHWRGAMKATPDDAVRSAYEELDGD